MRRTVLSVCILAALLLQANAQFGDIGNFFSNVGNTIANTANSVGDDVSNVADNVGNDVKNAANTSVNAVKNGFNTVEHTASHVGECWALEPCPCAGFQLRTCFLS